MAAAVGENGNERASAAGRPTALVTGASRGLGLVLARYLANRGYRLLITARTETPLVEAAAELQLLTEVVAVPGDVAASEHRRRLADLVGGRLELLVNNASDLGTSPLPPLVDYDLDRIRALLEVNVLAPIDLVRQSLPALQAARGRVINISSDAARGGYPGWGAYGASKAALELLSLTLANELSGVTVVTVDPGDMRTEMHQSAFAGEDIGDRPLPDVTLPFWAWLLEQEGASVNSRRFEAQAPVWELA